MSVPTISALPTAPQVTDTPTVFSDRANTFVAALSTLVSETNTTVGAINDALAGALVAFNGYQGDWSAGSYASGDVVRNDGIFYISLTGSNTQEPPDTNWQALEIAGSTAFDPANVALTGTNLQDAVEELCTLPPTTKSTDYTLAAADVGGLVSISSGTLTVPPSIFSAGDVVVVYNNAATDRTIARGSGVTMYWVDGLNENRTLAQRGLATIVCVASNTFVITGQGLS